MNLFAAYIVTACFFFVGLFVWAVINRSVRIQHEAHKHVVRWATLTDCVVATYADLVRQVAEKTDFKTSSLDDEKIFEEQVEHLRKLGFKI